MVKGVRCARLEMTGSACEWYVSVSEEARVAGKKTRSLPSYSGYGGTAWDICTCVTAILVLGLDVLYRIEDLDV